MNRRFRLGLLFIAVLPVLKLQAQEQKAQPDINLRTVEHLSSFAQTGRFVSDRSAAAAFFRSDHAFTELKGQLDWRHEDEAFDPAQGNEALGGMFRVESYLRLDPRSAVFAGADYTNGTLRNVRWNSTSDYRLLYPYILADSIGGDLKQEQYHFYGGYTRMDGRFNYGITAGYRASQAYRQVDPRPRNITAELSADLSAGYRSGTYVLGVAGGIRTYKQQQSVDFYDPNGANTSELHFTGLGTFYRRYSGTSFTDTQYRGTGYHAALTLVPHDGAGWYALADYDHWTVDRNLDGLNTATLTTLTVHTLTGGLACKHPGQHVDWAVKATGAYSVRQGTEHVMGSGDVNDNQPLAGQQLYKSREADARVEGLVEWKRPAGRWSLRPSTDFRWTNEEYVYPRRRLEMAEVNAGAAVGFTRLQKAWLLDASVGGWHAVNLTGTFDIPLDDTDLRIYRYLETSYRRRTDSRTMVEARVRVQRRLSLTTALFLSACYGRQFYGEGMSDGRLQVAAGLCF